MSAGTQSPNDNVGPALLAHSSNIGPTLLFNVGIYSIVGSALLVM